MIVRAVVVAIFGLTVAATTSGEEVTYSFPFTLSQTGVVTQTFPKIDPNVGTITRFSDSFSGSLSIQRIAVENLASTKRNVFVSDTVAVRFPGFDGHGFGVGIITPELQPFDGVADFSGPDTALCGMPATSLSTSSFPTYHDFTGLQGTDTFSVSLERRISFPADIAAQVTSYGAISGTYLFTLIYAAPEPSAAVLLGAGAIALATFQLRRRRRQ
jgi:hypothetical protein